MSIQLRFANCFAAFTAVVLACGFTTAAPSVKPDEMREKDAWVKKYFVSDAAQPPFSFVLGDKPSGDLLKTWKKSFETKKLDDARTQYSLSWTDPATGMEVRCTAIDYADYPTVEWTVYLKNGGKADSPIVSKVQAIDVRIDADASAKCVLHYNAGTTVTAKDFEPLTAELPKGKQIPLVPGRGTSGGIWPYFNLQCGDGGRIVVIGWPGRWAINFDRETGEGIRVAAGQELVNTKLLPGEEIRTPLMVQQFYRGDVVRAQNIWRRWMKAHSMPKPGGKLPPPQLNACSSHQFAEMINANEENQKLFVDRYLEEGIKIDYWWMDAGWYPCGGQWPHTGNWEVDKTRFPNGLRAVSDHARKKGVKTIVWFEPERLVPGTWLHNNHKDWTLGDILLNMGEPKAVQWAIEHFGKMIEDEGIDLYRQDYNIEPLPLWRSNDAADRQGMTENKYVCGYLAYWDGLLKRFPNLLIDSCASGGHRNDLETLRRSVPLLRSDYLFEPIGQQGHTYGLAQWLPFFGTGERVLDTYLFRSCMSASHTLAWDVRDKNLNYDTARKIISEWKAVSPCFLGDYYPLTPYSLEKSAWMAWQFDVPESGEGLVQAFRHDECANDKITLKLQGLEPDATYEVTDVDVGVATKISGKSLMEEGLAVEIKTKPGAAVVRYKKSK